VICLFIYFIVLTIHLDLVEDISAEEFLLCLCCFIARCGAPRITLSDNTQKFKAIKWCWRKHGEVMGI